MWRNLGNDRAKPQSAEKPTNVACVIDTAEESAEEQVEYREYNKAP